MRLQPACVPCLVKQVHRLLEPVPLPAPRKMSILVDACGFLRDHFSYHTTTTAFGTRLYRHIYQAIGQFDPLAAEKAAANHHAQELLARQDWTTWTVIQRIRSALAGNVIDHALGSVDYDLDRTFAGVMHDLGAVHGSIDEFVAALSSARSVLYLLDNCGEIVLDRPLLAWLKQRGTQVYIAAGDGIMCNDASLDDARAMGLGEFGALVSKGPAMFGVIREEWPAPFAALWREVDVIVAKGQAYFESLGAGVEPRLWHLFRVKCPLVADQLDLPVTTHVIELNARLVTHPSPTDRAQGDIGPESR